MFKRRLNEPFGKAGVAIGVVALVFAMLGGAYAASGGKQTATASKSKKHSKKKSNAGLNGTQKKEVKKISQTEAKKFATAGPAGAVGAAGPAGPAGPAGAKGERGDTGATGAAGAAGTGVTTASYSGPECLNGGVEVQSAGGSSYVCNGEEGVQGVPGAPGSPWLAGTAPSGVEMKGTWSIQPFTAAGAGELIPVSFSTGVPISNSENVGVFVMAPGETNVGFGCSGSAEEPKSDAFNGILCVYEGSATNVSKPAGGAGMQLKKSGGGVVALFKSTGPGVVSAYGSWALKTP
jgi:hypothetical protein